MDQEQRTVLDQEQGDFACRCMPRTCSVFVEAPGRKRSSAHGEDPFDDFLQQRVAFLSYMIRAYYELGRPPELQLVKFGSEKMLDSMNVSMFARVVSRSSLLSATISSMSVRRSAALSMLSRTNRENSDGHGAPRSRPHTAYRTGSRSRSCRRKSPREGRPETPGRRPPRSNPHRHRFR